MVGMTLGQQAESTYLKQEARNIQSTGNGVSLSNGVSTRNGVNSTRPLPVAYFFQQGQAYYTTPQSTTNYR